MNHFWIDDVILSLNWEKKVQRCCWSFILNFKLIKTVIIRM